LLERIIGKLKGIMYSSLTAFQYQDMTWQVKLFPSWDDNYTHSFQHFTANHKNLVGLEFGKLKKFNNFNLLISYYILFTICCTVNSLNFLLPLCFKRQFAQLKSHPSFYHLCLCVQSKIMECL